MNEKPQAPATRVDRRAFLRGAGLAAAAVPVTASAERLVRPTDNQLPGRYKDTEHVRRFYAMNRR